MSKKLHFSVFLPSVLLLTAGCFGPTDEDKIKTALEQHFNFSGGYCIYREVADGSPSLMGGPIRKNAPMEFNALDFGGGSEETRIVEALVEVGVVSRNGCQSNRKYCLTDLGMKSFAKYANLGNMGGIMSCIGVGKRKVDKIEEFTKPADAFGKVVTQVRYTYYLSDIPEWARNAQVQKAVPQLAHLIGGGRIRDKATLFQTNQGWKHEFLDRFN